MIEEEVNYQNLNPKMIPEEVNQLNLNIKGDVDMKKKINKLGEININNFGSKMIITRCNGAIDIDVYFP